MVSDAESHAEDDKRQRELAEARNTAENAAYQAERQLTELGDAVDASSKEEIESAIKAVRESLTSEDAEDIKAKGDALNAAFHKVSEAMYQKAQEQSTASEASDGASSNGGSSGDGASADEEDVVDAEVVDEN
jgi:molecular chaperone DnaK